MTKRKATVLFTVLAVVIILLTAFCVMPPFETKGRYDFKSPALATTRGTDFNGGASVILKVSDNSVENLETELNKAVDIMYDRAVELGESELYLAAVKNQAGEYGVLLKCQNVAATNAIADALSRSGIFSIREEDEDGEIITDASNIKQARPLYDQSANTWFVQLTFTKKGADEMKEKTSQMMIGSVEICFMMDGEQVLVESIKDPMKGRVYTISGVANGDAAFSLAAIINHGSFGIKFEKFAAIDIVLYTSDAIENFQTAFMITLGALAVVFIVLLIVQFKLFGVAAVLSILLFICASLIALAFLPFISFTYASATGLLLSLVLVYIFNVIQLKKIKSEYVEGKTLRRAISEGFRKSRMFIVDTGAVLFGTSIAMWILGIVRVVSLATMVFVTSIFAVLSSIFVSRLFIHLLSSVYSDYPAVFKLDKGVK